MAIIAASIKPHMAVAKPMAARADAPKGATRIVSMTSAPENSILFMAMGQATENMRFIEFGWFKTDSEERILIIKYQYHSPKRSIQA
ncbi:MAG: hypothetical protein OIF58_09445 [Cohaesibacter sp.]|nr:hypothetical protein [Cohaesibacter sp.]